MTTRHDLHRLIDQLPEGTLSEAERLLDGLRNRTDDNLPRFLMEAPPDDEPETDEERAAIAEAYDDLRHGRVVSMEEIKRAFGL